MLTYTRSAKSVVTVHSQVLSGILPCLHMQWRKGRLISSTTLAATVSFRLTTRTMTCSSTWKTSAARTSKRDRIRLYWDWRRGRWRVLPHGRRRRPGPWGGTGARVRDRVLAQGPARGERRSTVSPSHGSGSDCQRGLRPIHAKTSFSPSASGLPVRGLFLYPWATATSEYDGVRVRWRPGAMTSGYDGVGPLRSDASRIVERAPLKSYWAGGLPSETIVAGDRGWGDPLLVVL